MTSSENSPRQRLRSWLLGFAVILAALFVTRDPPARRGCWDFYQFWWTGHAVVASGETDVYSTRGRERLFREGIQQAGNEEARRGVSGRRLTAAKARSELENYSTPLLYSVFGLAGSGNYDRDLAIFRIVSTTLFTLGIFALARALEYGWLRLIGLVAVLLLLFQPGYSDVVQGNVNRLQVGVLAFALALGRPGASVWSLVTGGAMLGFLVLFKPNTIWVVVLLVMLPVLTGQRRRAMLRAVGTGAGAIAGLVLSIATFGSHRPWIDWIARLGELRGVEFPLADGNTALGQVLVETTGLHLSLLVSAVFLGLTACWLLLAKKIVATLETNRGGFARASFSMEIAAGALGATLPLFTSNLAWAHYHTFSALMVVYLLRPRVPGDLQVKRSAGIVLAIGGLALMCVPSGSAVIAGTLLLFALVVTESMWSLAAAPSPSAQRA